MKYCYAFYIICIQLENAGIFIVKLALVDGHIWGLVYVYALEC